MSGVVRAFKVQSLMNAIHDDDVSYARQLINEGVYLGTLTGGLCVVYKTDLTIRPWSSGMTDVLYDMLMLTPTNVLCMYLTAIIVDRFNALPIEKRVALYKYTHRLPQTLLSFSDQIILAREDIFFPGYKVVMTEYLRLLDISSQELAVVTAERDKYKKAFQDILTVNKTST